MTFTLTDEGQISKTVFGNYSLGIFDVYKDDYETMSLALKEIVILA